MQSLSLPQSGDYHKPYTPVTLKGDAALAYAEKSIPVFPCKPGRKEPLTPHGHLDATTDPETIRRWWRKYPEANVGIPTGKRSGLLVADVDPNKGGYDSLMDLDERGHGLPSTRVVRTGGDGLHFYLRYPKGVTIKNSAGKLGLGLDIRGEGGYVVAPPSATGGPYEVLHDRPLDDTPEWLVEALSKPSEPARGKTETVSQIKVDATLEGPEIPTGERNPTLYKIACALRARGYDRGGIMEALEGVNRGRCSSPLDRGELEKIAKSASRHTPGNASPEVSEEVIAAVGEIEDDIMRRGWSGVGGKSERDTMVALTKLARMHGTQIPTGVRVSVDVRTLALMASVSKRALLDNRKGGERVPGIISRLKARGVLRSDNGTRSGKEAGAFVLLTSGATRARLHHSTTYPSSLEPVGACGATLRTPLSAPRLRWSRPVFDGATRVGTISRLGKTKGAVVDHLEASPSSSLPLAELAARLGMSRVRDLRRRHLEPLGEAGVVECSGDAVSLTAEWLHALNERCDQDGEVADHRRDMARYQRERDAYRERENSPPTPHPANAGADGYAEDLETVPEPPAVEDLYPLVDGRVQTRRGSGKLWQVFSDRIGVVLEEVPNQVTFMAPSELVVSGVTA